MYGGGGGGSGVEVSEWNGGRGLPHATFFPWMLLVVHKRI